MYYFNYIFPGRTDINRLGISILGPGIPPVHEIIELNILCTSIFNVYDDILFFNIYIFL